MSKQEQTAIGMNTSSARPWKILVVEDEEVVRRVLEEILHRLGYGVIAAADGYEALDIFHTHAAELDLVLFDMSMPRMSGDVLFNKLRQAAPEMKTLLTSGYSDVAPIDEMRSQGLSGFLPKPFTIKQVRDELHRVLNSNDSRPA
jgi:two-component system, cell cycle sensor histidine kinase and response regulator CckA